MDHNSYIFSRSTPNLQHYCRVCNTQLNSCKQAQIHTDGKKHEKRLSYLKFSLGTGTSYDLKIDVILIAYKENKDIVRSIISICFLGLQNGASTELSSQIPVEQRNLPPNDMTQELSIHSFKKINNNSVLLLDQEIPKNKKESSKPQHRPISISGTSNNACKTNLVSYDHSTQQFQSPTVFPNVSTLQNDSGAHLFPPLLPPMPPPPILQSPLSATSNNSVGGGGAQPFAPPYGQFPTSCSYYFQQPTSTNAAIQSASSAIYDKSPITHSKSSSLNEYQQPYISGIPESSICGTVPSNSSTNTIVFPHPSPSAGSTQTEATSINQQQAAILSSQMIPSMFTPTMMNIHPVASVSSLSSMNCNITDATTSDLNSSTPLSSVNYNINHQMNTSMPFPDTNQSFSIDSNHGLPLQNHHLSTSFNSPTTICQTPNAIEAPFYNTDGEITYPYSDHSEHASFIQGSNDGKFKLTNHNGNSKLLKDKRCNNVLYKNNNKKFSMSMAVKHNRSSFNNANSDAEITGVTENSDGYTSSVSHSSARNSSQIHSLSSTSGSNKMYKSNTSQQLLPSYQKQAPNKQKQHKCQSLDRSSDSDFTSQLSGVSKKKDLASSMRTCDLCKLTFPSPSVLDNHLKGSKHTRKVKSQQAFRQLQDNGTNLRQNIIHEDGTFEEDLTFGEISCEVCEVSVNSSHQLQAHLAGK